MAKLMRLARPHFLLAGLALFVFGASWAILLGAPFSLPRLLLGYLILLAAHLSVSYSNDYFDVEVDRHGSPALFSGGSGVLVDHPELRRPARWIALALIGCSLAMGVLFLAAYSVPPWFLGYVLIGNLLGWFYSAPPSRLAYRGLGELATAVTAGLLAPGMGYLVTRGYLDREWLPFALPLMLYGLAFILSVEIPDEEADRLGSKRTAIVRKGRRFGFTAIGVLLFLATGYFFCFAWLRSRPYPLDFRVPGALSLLPLGAGVVGALKRPAQRQPATRMVNAILIILTVFFVLTDGYLICLAARSMARSLGSL
jgi:1,4-dihydroxy-2-naphthoate octaprenyltransferase